MLKTQKMTKENSTTGTNGWAVEVDGTDFDMVRNNGDIPKYRDIVENIDNGDVSQYNAYFLDTFKKFEGIENIVEVKKGMVVTGIVTMISDREVIVDIGNKDNVIIDRKGSEEKIIKQLAHGQEIDVLIVQISESPYLIKGSVAELVRMKVDSKMKNFYQDRLPIDAYVKEMIPAGYLLDISIDGISIEAFMPNTLADVNKLYDPTSILNEKVTVMLETLQQDKGIYVVSRKKYLKTLQQDKIKFIKSQPKDTVYTGHVTGTREFGIFVQFEDCLTGMIHKANIHEDYRDRLTEIQPGTLIDFYVKDVIKNGSQIILTQILKESLWDTIRVGDTIEGKVITVKPFGALIALDYETNGLIQTTYLNKNNKSLKAGDKVNVVVISIIRDDRKVYLTFADDKETIARLKDKPSEIEKLKQKFNSKD